MIMKCYVYTVFRTAVQRLHATCIAYEKALIMCRIWKCSKILEIPF